MYGGHSVTFVDWIDEIQESCDKGNTGVSGDDDGKVGARDIGSISEFVS